MPIDTTPNLEMPYLLAAQAQKHVTHNEAIRALDALVQLGVADKDLNAPPASPANGQRYIVGASPSGAWSGRAYDIAAFQDGAWTFYEPREGWAAWVADEDKLYVWDGAAWIVPGAGAALQNVPLLGVNAAADATNKLALNSAASLFNNNGAGHQIKINKAVATDTASVLYQTGFSGRAEFGTTGDDNFHVKVSPDGSAWTEALTIDAVNGRLGVFKPAPARALDVTGDIGGANLTLSGVLQIGSNSPLIRLIENDAATDAKRWLLQANGAALTFALGNDANTATTNFLRVARSTMTTTAIEFTGPVSSQGAMLPQSDNAHALGSPTNRWSVVYAATGTINTSDARLKTDIEDCPLGLDFICDLKPKLYRWIEGGTDVDFVETDDAEITWPATAEPETNRRIVAKETRRAGRRRHAGLLAQDVKRALDNAGVDCGLWLLDDKDDGESGQSLRYDQFIAPLVRAVQDLSKRVCALEAKG